VTPFARRWRRTTRDLPRPFGLPKVLLALLCCTLVSAVFGMVPAFAALGGYIAAELLVLALALIVTITHHRRGLR
jgi:fatty acid desaturase